MSTNAPIALFVYNRLYHTKQTIEALKNNFMAKESVLYIYSDANKNIEDKPDVDSVREYISKVQGFKKVYIIKRETNYGLAKSIIEGVTSIINNYNKAIVLEDDLVTSPYFLQYMNKALEYYSRNERVMQISGYSFPIENNSNNAYLLPITSTWGWATWDTSWEKLIVDSKPYLQSIKKQKKDFNFNSSYNYFSMLVNQILGENSSWGIRWYLSVFLNKGVCLYPSSSLVNNIGHDGSGEHCKKTIIYDTKLADSNKNIFPDSIDERMITRVQTHLKLNKRKRILNYLFAFFNKGIK